MRIRRDVPLQPVQIAVLARRAGHDQKGVLGEARHREIGLDAAALVQPLRIDDAAGRDRDVVRADPLQRRFGVAPLKEELAERGQVEQTDALAHGPVLVRPVLEPGGAPVGVVVLGRDAGRREPARPLPAGRLGEAGAARLEAIMERRGARRPRRGVLPKRPVHRVEQARAPRSRARADSAALLWNGCMRRMSTSARSMGGWPPTIHSASTLPAPPADWMPIELKPQATKNPAQLGRLAEQIAIIRREALRAAEELADADPLERRNAPHRVLEESA